MPDKAISQLSATTTLATTDLIPVVAGTTTSKITADNFFKSAPTIEVTGLVKFKNAATVSSGNISLTEFCSVLENVTGIATNLTLPAGTNGLLKSLVSGNVNANVVVSVTGGVGVVNLTFTATGQAANLYYQNGWYVLSKNGAT
jgi:molybdopterin-binding protein